MKMKLAQRLLIGYYKTRIKTIGFVSPRKAAERAWKLFCTPYPGKAPKKIPPVFASAAALSFDLDGIPIRGFRWEASEPGAKKILLIHGFSSYSYKFEKYIAPLQQLGFEILAFDAPAHGLSGGKTINAYIYKQAILKFDSIFGPIHGFLGHSLGGLAASLAFEELTGNLQKKLVLVAPATETYRTIQDFLTLFSVENKTKEAFIRLTNELTEHPISYYSVSRVVKEISSPVLWVHDKQDTICSFEDVKPLLNAGLPHVQFLITEQLGHNKIYKNPMVCDAIVRFFGSNAS